MKSKKEWYSAKELCNYIFGYELGNAIVDNYYFSKNREFFFKEKELKKVKKAFCKQDYIQNSDMPPDILYLLSLIIDKNNSKQARNTCNSLKFIRE